MSPTSDDPEHAESDEDIKLIAQGSAVQIRDSLGELVGSGVVVSIAARSFDVLTAFHVIEGRDRFGVDAFIESRTDSLGPTHSFDAYVRHWGVVVIDTDRENDLAYLRVASLNRPREVVFLAAEPVDAPPPPAAWVIDSTELGPPDVQKVDGLMLETAKRPQEGRSVQMWRIDQQSKPGMSGSALLNAQGRLIGLASGNNGGDAYYCGLNKLRDFVHRVTPSEVRVLRGDRDASDAEEWLTR
ncbi:S1 family peptidase [Stieleria maiorica]|nr:serine protease [Stieleria maiorica]